jgi:superfamily II DNA/RNA helicase
MALRFLLSKTFDWSEILESFVCLLVSTHQEATSMANEKKVALVTGSNRGIGLETARQLGQQGGKAIVTARTEREAVHAASKLRSEGIEAEALAGKVTIFSISSQRPMNPCIPRSFMPIPRARARPSSV